MTEGKPRMEKKEFRVALVRVNVDDEEATERILAIETTYAVSARQAVNNVRYRNGGYKALANYGGSSHALWDEWKIAPDGSKVGDFIKNIKY